MMLSCHDICESEMTHSFDVCMYEAEFMHVLQTVECLFKLETPNVMCHRRVP
jgi:hypothetical protein